MQTLNVGATSGFYGAQGWNGLPQCCMFIAAPSTVRLIPYVQGRLKVENMSGEEMKAELARLRNENAALKKSAATGITMKVSEKGGLSVYGMGRFPITLYKEQWLKLLDMSDPALSRSFNFAVL